jgi:hypothetical protein
MSTQSTQSISTQSIPTIVSTDFEIENYTTSDLKLKLKHKNDNEKSFISKHIKDTECDNNDSNDSDISSTFLIGNITYTAPKKIYSKSEVLSVLADQKIFDDTSDRKIKVFVPNKIRENSDIIETVLEILDDVCDNKHSPEYNCYNNNCSKAWKKYSDIISSIRQIKHYDECINLLKYLRYKNADRFIDKVRDHIKKYLSEKTYDNQYLYDLIDSSMSDIISDHDTEINIDLDRLIKDMIVSPHVINRCFTELIKNACKTNKSEFLNLTNLILESSKLNFCPGNVRRNFFDMSFGVLTNEFFDEFDKLSGVFIAGGSLVDSFMDHRHLAPYWSDIDIWVTQNMTKEISDETNKIEDLSNLKNVLNLLTETFKKSGRDKLLWSARKNVITLYCADYKRNIQIVLINDVPQMTIEKFDIDCMKAYYKGGEIFGMTQFLLSNIEKKVSTMDTTISPERIVKMMMKGYDFDKQLKTSNTLLLNNNSSEICSIASNVMNKYYYPTLDEVNSFDEIIDESLDKSINKSVTEYFPNFKSKMLGNRLVYLIGKATGHKNIFKSIEKLLIEVKTIIKNTNKSVLFTTSYDNDDNERVKFLLNTIHINNVDLEKIVPLNLIEAVNNNSPMTILPLKYLNGNGSIHDRNSWTKLCFETDPIKLQWYPFAAFHEMFNITPNDPNIFKLKLWSMDNSRMDKGAQKLFELIENLDDKFEKILDKNFKLNIGSSKNIKNIKYSDRVTTVNHGFDLIDSDDDDDKPKSKKIKGKSNKNTSEDDSQSDSIITKKMFKKSIKFGLWYGNEFDTKTSCEKKLMTKVTYLGDCVKINQLSDLHNYVTKDATVKLTIILNTIKIGSGNMSRERPAYLCPIITRIDVIENPYKKLKKAISKAM